MVDEAGQLYTIEGIAASVLILTTLYLVLTTTTVFTPSETHVYDMQLEQLGNDVLAVMDMNQTWGDPHEIYPKSPLEKYIENNNGPGFTNVFLQYSNQTADGRMDKLHFNASIIYRNQSMGVMSKPFAGDEQYNRENAVKVSRWINIDNTDNEQPELDPVNQTVLLEVLLWRG